MYCLLVCAAFTISPGDILLTRNAGGEDINRSPGWWNHTALYIGNNHVVEAQEGQGVICTPFKEFYNRYPYIAVLRPKRYCIHTQTRMCVAAKNMIGTKYAKTASIWFAFFDFSSGNNCVSVVRRAFGCGHSYDPLWRIPDDLATDWRLRLVESKGLKKKGK